MASCRIIFSYAFFLALSLLVSIQFKAVATLMRLNSRLRQEPPRWTGEPALETA